MREKRKKKTRKKENICLKNKDKSKKTERWQSKERKKERNINCYVFPFKTK